MLIVEKTRYRVKTRPTQLVRETWHWWLEVFGTLDKAKQAVAASKSFAPMKYEYRIVKWEIQESEVG